MKIFRFIVGALILASNPSWAESCPQALEGHKKGRQIFEWLGKFEGTTSLKSCEIEVVLCEEGAPGTGPLAEIFIRHSSGREAYLPLLLPSVESPRLFTKIQVNKRMLHYELFDKFYEEELGRTEAYRLEILTEWDDQNRLKSLDLGVYSTRHQLNQPNGNDSEWFNCGQ